MKIRSVLFGGAAAALLGVAAAGASAGQAQAQSFQYQNAQLLFGTRFDDPIVGSDPREGRMTTVTLEAGSVWRFGDNFFFVDLMRGDFQEGPAGRHRVYAEWAPRLSLSRITGANLGFGPVGDILIAGGMDRGSDGFASNQIGVGTNLRIPGFTFLQLNVYRRDDVYNPPTYQITPVWGLPLGSGRLQGVFTGFADFVGADGGGLDLMAQPQLLLDLGALAGTDAGRLQAGIEWYLHRVPDYTSSVPQVMVKFFF
jgi:nucleoside-specific outer membrane channel protein Tsx